MDIAKKQPRYWCMVKNCPGYGFMYGLPSDKRRRDMWLANLNMEEWETRHIGRVCSRHFDIPNDHYKFGRWLPRYAIPTLCLGHDKPVVHVQEIPDKRKKMRQCGVEDCRSTNKTHTLYLLPKDEPRRAYWRKVCRFQGNSSYSYACSKHFEPHCQKKRRLCSTAVPTLFLNNNDQSIRSEGDTSTNSQISSTEEAVEEENETTDDSQDGSAETLDEEPITDLDGASNSSNEAKDEYFESVEYLEDVHILATDSKVDSFECLSVGESKEKRNILYAEEDCACACAIENVKLKNQYDKKIKEMQAIIDILYTHRRKLEKQIIAMVRMQSEDAKS